MRDRVVVIDYDAGNLRSVARALAHVGADPIVSADPAEIAAAGALVLPGVGAAADTMRNLRERGLIEPIRDYIAAGRPFLGVCMGLQALLERSEEGGQECLGVLPGEVRRFPAAPGLKVPHMGWNTVEWRFDHPVTEGIPSGSYFYFVHSYHPTTPDPALVLGETEYGVRFPSVLARGYLVATQCHPEKSGRDGLRFYANFVRWAREGAPMPAAAAAP
ncbi:imidazole glycerol phosphate synthase subunit HisH [Tepidiforma flava]|uniref:Imidazole glycerol phosphate synthase subunit HisH n=1 Tax=Tepidiforma flava TaxID=3004094 RepID=A0ABY7M8W3_9CHLR|nr:imidazole glycerol phosphate synthase subunit HisH [Tepidiforma flava]WBL36535.1 imidazole glycerol phosphate synthase subunit HisH [Tepidiforma flava]